MSCFSLLFCLCTLAGPQVLTPARPNRPVLLLLEPRPTASCWEGVERWWEARGVTVSRLHTPPLPAGWEQAAGVLIGESLVRWQNEWPGLQAWVKGGGKLLLWRLEDRQAESSDGLSWTDQDADHIEFAAVAHPLLGDWRGQRWTATRPLVQDAVKLETGSPWQALARSPAGVALAVLPLGQGEMAAAQFGPGFWQRPGTRQQWADHVLNWFAVVPPAVQERPLDEWLAQVTDRLLGTPAAERPADWDTSLLMLGLLEAGEVLRRTDLRVYVADWLRRHEAALQHLTIDRSALVAPAVRLDRLTGQAAWDGYPRRLWKWLLETAPKAYNAGLLYEGRSLALNTLYPLPALLAEWDREARKPLPGSFAAWQLMAHLAHLYDPRTGLLFHMWDADEDRVWGEYWGQGNARALLGIAETVRWLRPGAPPQRALQTQWHQLLEAVLKLQRPSGAWGLLLDDPRSPDDFLATVLILAAVEHYPWEEPGQLPRAACDLAFQWVAAQVDAHGEAPPVFLTPLAAYRQHYLRTVARASPAGNGALLVLLSARWRRLEGERLQGGMQATREEGKGHAAPQP